MENRILLSEKESELTDSLIEVIKEQKVTYKEAEKALEQTAQELFQESREQII
ncbi:TPA: hypothetical protein I0F94_RS02150 [Enterococcus faecalis]|nr:hypothetical protein [Enterococcus faecalis]